MPLATGCAVTEPCEECRCVDCGIAVEPTGKRLKPEAQFEIREYAKAVLELIRPSLVEMGIDRP